MSKIIVIGGNHPNTLGLIRSIGENGIPITLMLEPCKTLEYCSLRFSKYIQKKYFLKAEEEILEILNRDYSAEEDKPIILCASDAAISLLDTHYNELKDRFCFFNAGVQGRINHFMNKKSMFPLAEECGLLVIKTWRVTNRNRLPSDITFPCLTKPNNSLGGDKEDIHICQNMDELESCLRDGVDYLIQEYIEKDFELDINGISLRHGEEVVIPAVCRKIRDYTSRQSDYIVLEDVLQYPQVNFDAIKSFVSAIGYEGLFSVEFLCRGNNAYFLEINMRNDGVNYLYTSTGVNTPMRWVNYCNQKLEVVDKKNCKTPTYLMQQADFSNVLHHKISLSFWLKDLMRTRAFFVLSWRDPKPFLYTMWINFKLVLRKLHLIR